MLKIVSFVLIYFYIKKNLQFLKIQINRVFFHPSYNSLLKKTTNVYLSHTPALTFNFTVHSFQMDFPYSFTDAVLNGLSWNPDQLDHQPEPECSPEDDILEFPEWTLMRTRPASLTPPCRIPAPLRFSPRIRLPTDIASIAESNVPNVSAQTDIASIAESKVPNVSLQVFKTQKGAVGVLFEGFRFRKHKQLKNSISWKCDTCDVRIRTTMGHCLLGTQNKQHDHLAPENSDQNVSAPSTSTEASDSNDIHRSPTASISYSKFGNPVLIIDNYTFCKHSSVHDVVYWQCVVKQCKASCHTENDLNSIVFLNNIHNHLHDKQDKVQKNVVRQNVK